VKVDFKISGLEGVLATLKSLPPEIVSKRGGPVKLALAKGARLIRDEAKKNLRASIAIRGADSTGTTVKSVIATRGKAPSSGKGERYLVRVKKATFVNAKGQKTSTLMTANLLEYGSAHQPATPWLRPAVISKGQQAIDVIVSDLKRRIDLTVRKLAAQNKAKG
jgi:HK97 gp10 family phage protein